MNLSLTPKLAPSAYNSSNYWIKSFGVNSGFVYTFDRMDIVEKSNPQNRSGYDQISVYSLIELNRIDTIPVTGFNSFYFNDNGMVWGWSQYSFFGIKINSNLSLALNETRFDKIVNEHGSVQLPLICESGDNYCENNIDLPLIYDNRVFYPYYQQIGTGQYELNYYAYGGFYMFQLVREYPKLPLLLWVCYQLPTIIVAIYIYKQKKKNQGIQT